MIYYKEIKDNEVIAYYGYDKPVTNPNLVEISKEEYETALEELSVEVEDLNLDIGGQNE